MKTIEKKISQVWEDPNNAREHSEKSVSAIAESLSKFGQVKPIVIDKSGKVIAGNGTLSAARSLGWRTLHAIEIDVSEDVAKAYAIADNRTAEFSRWDFGELFQQLDDLRDDVELLRATGFDESDIDSMRAKLNLGDGEEKEVSGDPVEKEKFHKISITLSAADYERFKAAALYLQDVYNTDQDSAIFTAVENHAIHLREN